MEKFLRPLLILNIFFALSIGVLGIWNLAKIGVQPATLGIGLIGLIAIALAFIGEKKDSAYMTGGGALGVGIIFPTQLGIAPMVVGFVLAMALISLQFYLDNISSGK